jgi:hypothetical protein
MSVPVAASVTAKSLHDMLSAMDTASEAVTPRLPHRNAHPPPPVSTLSRPPSPLASPAGAGTPRNGRQSRSTRTHAAGRLR